MRGEKSCSPLLRASISAPTRAAGAIEEVVVTGSYIKGTPEDAALPVDVIGRDDLEKLGSPSINELVRNLGITSGKLDETNQFRTGGQGNEGVSTINLRGPGGARTLELLNGRRHVATETQGVDISALPISAVSSRSAWKGRIPSSSMWTTSPKSMVWSSRRVTISWAT